MFFNVSQYEQTRMQLVRSELFFVALFVFTLALPKKKILVLETMSKRGNNVSSCKVSTGKRKMFLNLLGNILASWEKKFCLCNNVSMGKQRGNISVLMKI